MDKISIGRVLKIIRIANDLSIVELARKVGVSNTYICELEKGKKQASQKILDRILAHYNLNKDNLELFVKFYDSINLDDLKKYQLTMLNVLNTMLTK